jgi:predicted ABC-type ATPase
MMVFDRKGQENFNNHALRNPASSATDKLGTLGENVDLNWDVAKYQHLGISESLNFREPIQNQFKLMYDLTGDEQYNKRFLSHQIVGAKKKAGEASQKDFDLNKRFFESQHDAIIKLQEQHPDAGLQTWSQMSEKRNEELKQMNIDLQNLQDRSQTFDVSVGNVASMGAYFMDPELLATLPFSGGASVGGRIAANAWRSFKIESGLAFVSESVIAPKVYDFQHQIGNEEYNLKDAVIRIMTATLGAGVIRAGGSVTIDLSKIALAKAKLLKTGKVAEANTLDDYVKMVQDASLVKDEVGNIHIMAQAKTKEAFEKGEILSQKDLDDMLGNISSQKIDPNEIQVDAKTFQYKTKTDDLGVSDALKGVKKWEPIKADSILVWERLDGARFVADGHQRLALAKRMIAGGEDAQDIGLSAFILREADGFGVKFAREYAALRNISSGSGTAIDAAKILRGSGKGLDNLPPNSALVRDARGLSRLDDEAFRLVVDEIVSQKYGAIVGDLISEAAEQTAVIRALAKAKPANATQARFMVQDMKAAGFTKTKTQDLFGGQEITESLFKERAKVIDNAIKKIKKDKNVFKTLAEQESRISGVGNKLDRDANLLRLSDDEKTLAALTSLANAKGPVSDAINVAARRIKDGESVQRATRDILPELRRSTEPGADARAVDDGAGDGQPALTIKEQIDNLPAGVTKLVVEPKDAPGLSIGILEKNGKARAVVEIDRSKIDIDCDNFCYPELKPILKDGHVLLQDTQKKYQFKNGKYKPARAKKHKEYIDSKLAEGTTAAKGEKPIVWLMGGGGASGKGTVLKKLQEDGIIPEKGFVHIDPDNVKLKIDEYKALSKQGDYRAASVVHGESSDIAKALQVAATDKKLNMIIDKTLGKEEKALKLIQDLKDSGYDVRLVGVTIDPSEALVRAQIRYFSSGRLVPPKMIIKAHKGFNAAFPAYAKKVDLAFLYDNTIKVVEIASARKGKITIVSKEAYNISQARGKLNETTTTHKQLRESQGLPGRLDGQDTPVIKNDSGGTQAADRGTHLRGDGEGRESKKLDGQSKNSEPNLDQIKIQEAQKLIDDLGDDFQMVSGVKDSGKGDTVLEFKTARETFKEIDNEQKLVDDLLKCVGS